MERDTFVRSSAVVIGATTLYFAGWALFRPASLAAAMRVSETHAHLLGYRDLISATWLLTRPDAGAFALRAAADAMDTVTLARARPGIAAAAGLFGVWSVAAGALAAQASRRP